jgi:hypothetical protein
MSETAEATSAYIQGIIAREIAQMEALDRALELAVLGTRAALAGIKPSVLARNLIRSGLLATKGAEVANAVS